MFEYFDLVDYIFFLLLLVFVVGITIGGVMFANSVYQDFKFDQKMGSYCYLSYDASSIDKKIEYYDTCLESLKDYEFEGHAAWVFKTPANDAKELYEVANSLQERMHNLKNMDRESFEYQKGLEQVEEEIGYFVHGGESISGVLGKFSRLYCFDHSWKYLCI